MTKRIFDLIHPFVFIYIDFPVLNLIPVQNCSTEYKGLVLPRFSFAGNRPIQQLIIDEKPYEI